MGPRFLTIAAPPSGSAGDGSGSKRLQMQASRAQFYSQTLSDILVIWLLLIVHSPYSAQIVCYFGDWTNPQVDSFS